jgi:hypothetical protein
MKNKFIISLFLLSATLPVAEAEAQVCDSRTIALCVRPPGYVGPTVMTPYVPPPIPQYSPPIIPNFTNSIPTYPGGVGSTTTTYPTYLPYRQ